MKTQNKNSLFSLVALLGIAAFFYLGNTSTVAEAASSSVIKSDSKVSTENVVTTQASIFGEYIQKPKKLAKDFTGYKIEVLTVYDKELPLSDELHQNFKNTEIDQRTSNSYTYLIGDFEDKEACETYLSTINQKRYPKARGMKYENGTIVKYE